MIAKSKEIEIELKNQIMDLLKQQTGPENYEY